MKQAGWKIFFGLIFLLALFALAGCGGGGSKASANNEQANGQATTPTTPTTPTQPNQPDQPADTTTPPPIQPPPPVQPPGPNQPPASLELAPIPASDRVLRIKVMVNQAIATLHPDAAIRIQQDIVAFNADLAKTTQERLALNQVIIYQDASELEGIAANPANFFDNNFAGNPNFGGVTVVYWTQEDISVANPAPKFFTDRVGYATGFASETSVNGKRYGLIYLAEMFSGAYLLLGKEHAPNYANGYSAYDSKLANLLHEIAHMAWGLGVPEQYSLKFKDNSGTLPNLGTYDYAGKFPEDPMIDADVITYDKRQNKFSPFNSWLMDHNANGQLNPWQIAEATKTMNVKVKVVDSLGLPVSGAIVTSFGGVATSGNSWGVAKDMETLLETLTTDASGLVSLTNDFHAAWFAKGVKAAHGGRYAGAVVTSLDLQESYWMLGRSTFELTLTLQ